MRKRILLCVLLLGLPILPLPAKNIEFKALREMAAKGTPVVADQDIVRGATEEGFIRYTRTVDNCLSIRGYVISSAKEPYHTNNGKPHQHSFYESSALIAMSTAWMVSRDGKYGIRLLFGNEQQCEKLIPNSFSEISLKGTTLVLEEGCLTVMGLTDKNILASKPCHPSDIPVREKRIGELTDADLFTFVRLKDCEFLIKNGAFINVLEEYMMRSESGRNIGWNHTDGWGRLVVDGKGDCVFMHMNSRFINRRSGDGIPQGKGTIEGMLVKTYLPRWGHTSCYGIRPVTDKSIRFDWTGEPGYKTLAAWDWNKPGDGIIPAAHGAGTMSCDCPGEIGRTFDTDNPLILKQGEPVKGLPGIGGRVDRGAIQITARACDWWDWQSDTPRALMLACSTQDVKAGSQVFVAFTINAGNGKPEGSAYYPSWWSVSWSTDGKHWQESTDEEVNIRAIPYNFYGRPLSEPDGERYVMCAESAIGYRECQFRLPVAASGQAQLYLRIHPSRKILGSMAYMRRDLWTLRPENTEICYVNFGEIVIGCRE